MAKKMLTCAPLVHSLIHLTFSDIPSLSSMSDEFLNNLHQKMIEQGFPEKIISVVKGVEITFDKSTAEANRVEKSIKRTLFRAAGEQQLIEINSSEGVASIIFKASKYDGFDEFDSTFNKVICGILEVEPALEKALLKSVGLRYVDVIVPNRDYKLSDFVCEGVIPIPLPTIPAAKHHFGIAMKRAETAAHQILNVRFEELPINEKRVTKVLPDNLIEGDSNCGLIINGQEQWLSVSCETYGILDVDHVYSFAGSPHFNVELIEEKIRGLYQGANQVFWSTITETAEDAWGVKEI